MIEGTLDLPPPNRSWTSAAHGVSGGSELRTVLQRAERHYIPAAVSRIAGNNCVTTYTPYKAEVSQGILRVRVPSLVCELSRHGRGQRLRL